LGLHTDSKDTVHYTFNMLSLCQSLKGDSFVINCKSIANELFISCHAHSLIVSPQCGSVTIKVTWWKYFKSSTKNTVALMCKCRNLTTWMFTYKIVGLYYKPILSDRIYNNQKGCGYSIHTAISCCEKLFTDERLADLCLVTVVQSDYKKIRQKNLRVSLEMNVFLEQSSVPASYLSPVI
jgi:hypothetical protein